MWFGIELVKRGGVNPCAVEAHRGPRYASVEKRRAEGASQSIAISTEMLSPCGRAADRGRLIASGTVIQPPTLFALFGRDKTSLYERIMDGSRKSSKFPLWRSP